MSAPGPRSIRDTPGLLAALASARPGDTVVLAPGVYSGVELHGLSFEVPVTIASQDLARPAVLQDLTVTRSSGLVFSHLDFSTVGAALSSHGLRPQDRAKVTYNFQVKQSHHLTFSHLHVYGDPKGTLQTDISGLIVTDSHHITLADSEFEHLHNAFDHSRVDYLTVSRNRFHDLWDDSIRGGGSSFVVISGNRFSSNHMDASDDDHPDCIQFWTSNTTAIAHDITVIDNIYTRGHGHPVQGIFFRDELTTLPFDKVTIKHNLIVGALYNGILVFGATNVDIEDNVVARYGDQKSWLGIRVVHGAVVKNNRSSQFVNLLSTDVKDSGNRLQDFVSDDGAALVKAWGADRGQRAADVGVQRDEAPRDAGRLQSFLGSASAAGVAPQAG